MTIWVTEFADANVTLAETQAFYNKSIAFFDATELVSCSLNYSLILQLLTIA